jgi:hypothetical protein
VVSFQYLRIELFYSVFGKKSIAALFFVWFKSRIQRSRSNCCLVGESYECRGGERPRLGERSHPVVFCGERAFQLFIVNFHMKI